MKTDTTSPPGAGYDIRFPSAADADLAQDEEWCEVRFSDGEARRIRFHDYEEIYPHPGLYEQIFAGRLECSSPERVVGLLGGQLAAHRIDPAALSVLDLGAGNGMVGESLRRLGIGSVIGVDIIEEAAQAAGRDRPGRYTDYLVQDLTALAPDTEERLRELRLGGLTCVAALGFGDIPPLAFAAAYDLLVEGAWLAFNIREEFLADGGSGFGELIREMGEAGWIETVVTERYVHRLSSVDGAPLHYVAIVARARHAGGARERAQALSRR